VPSMPSGPVESGDEESAHYPVRAGDVLDGKWRLEKKLGEGGMGSVFLAHDLQLDRKVAVKLLNVALANDAELVTRFEREARMTAGLEHPNIVPVYAVGRFHNRPFMVMKALEGVTLHSLVRSRGPLSPSDLLLMARQIASGLDFIHAKGFIHRDIKAANIFIGSDGLATILDFGILRPSRGAEALTRTGLVMGTPHYMSPEQAKGIREIDHRSDLYAFAVLLFECAAGGLPFESDNDLSVIQMQAHSAPPDLCDRAPWVPRTVGDVIAKALSKDPPDRYASAGDLYGAVELAYAEQSPLPLLPPLEVPGLMTSGARPAVLSGPRPNPSLPKRPPVGVMPTAPVPSIPGAASGASRPRPSGPAPALFTAPASGPMALPGIGMPLGSGPVPSSRSSNGTLKAVNGATEGLLKNASIGGGPVVPGTSAIGGAAVAVTPEPGEVSEEAPPSLLLEAESGQTQSFNTSPVPAARRRLGLYVLAVVLGLGGGAGIFFATLSRPPPPAPQLPMASPVASPVASPNPSAEVPGPGPSPGPPLAIEATKPEPSVPPDEKAMDTEEPKVPVEEQAPPSPEPPQPTPRPRVTSNPETARPGQLRIVSTLKNEPYWARVTVDGQKRGTTPLSLELRPGMHSVKLEREGFKPIDRQIKVAPGRSAVLRIELIR